MAFSSQIVNDLLRDKLGFKGYVNSDTGIITDRAWGLETATVPQRVAAAINGGTDTLSGFHDVQTITDLVGAGLVSQERVDLAAERLLDPLFPHRPVRGPRTSTSPSPRPPSATPPPAPSASTSSASPQSSCRTTTPPPAARSSR